MQNKEQSFDDLLNAVLKTWDEGGVSAVENQFTLEGEYKEIYDNICKCIDRNKEKSTTNFKSSRLKVELRKDTFPKRCTERLNLLMQLTSRKQKFLMKLPTQCVE